MAATLTASLGCGNWEIVRGPAPQAAAWAAKGRDRVRVERMSGEVVELHGVAMKGDSVSGMVGKVPFDRTRVTVALSDIRNVEHYTARGDKTELLMGIAVVIGLIIAGTYVFRNF